MEENGWKHYLRLILNIVIPLGGWAAACLLGPKLLTFFMPFVIGWIIAILTRQNKAATVSMIYGSGMRNISAGAVIAGAYFPAETLFPVMIGTLFQQILAAFYGSMMRRVQTGQQEREKEHGVSA